MSFEPARSWIVPSARSCVAWPSQYWPRWFASSDSLPWSDDVSVVVVSCTTLPSSSILACVSSVVVVTLPFSSTVVVSLWLTLAATKLPLNTTPSICPSSPNAGSGMSPTASTTAVNTASVLRPKRRAASR